MHVYHLSLAGGITVRLALPQPAFDDGQAQLLAGAYLPGLKFLPAPRTPTITIDVVESETPAMTCRNRRIRLWDKWQGTSSLLDVVNLIYSAARKCWLSQQLYGVHSACVDSNGGILLVGHSGAGKTSVAIALARARGGKIISGNKTLLALTPASLSAVAGTRTMTLAAPDAKRLGVESFGYQGRAGFVPPEVSFGDGVTPIRAIVLVRLNDGAKLCERLEPMSGLHRLYPFFLDAVNADTVLCSGLEVYSGSASRAAKAELSANLRTLLERVPSFVLAGSMKYVIRTLEGL